MFQIVSERKQLNFVYRNEWNANRNIVKAIESFSVFLTLFSVLWLTNDQWFGNFYLMEVFFGDKVVCNLIG